LIYERNLASSKVTVGEDLAIEARRIRTELVLYLNDAKKGGTKHS
jgi:precorrin-6B methylase 1